MRCRVFSRVLAFIVVMTAASFAVAQETQPPRDVDVWHENLIRALGTDIVEPTPNGWSLGLYPNLGLALGPPDWIAYQVGGYVSLTHRGKFSVFTGYTFERGPGEKTHMATLGWGGVRRLSGARQQRGFYGKFIRYRHMEDFDHGVHQGLSVGTETGAGVLGFSMEFGAARSPQNHWAVVVQVGLKVAIPVFISLTGDAATDPEG